MNEEKEQHLFENLYKRIGSLERENSAIVTNLESLTRAVNTLSTDVRQMKENSRFDWKTFAALGALVLSVIFYHGDGLIKPLGIEIDYLDKRSNFLNEEIKVLRSWKSEHDRNVSTVNSYQDSKLNELEKRIEVTEMHTKELGHPYVQTERVNQLEKRMDDKTYSRFTAHEGELHEKRMDSLENRIGAIESK